MTPGNLAGSAVDGWSTRKDTKRGLGVGDPPRNLPVSGGKGAMPERRVLHLGGNWLRYHRVGENGVNNKGLGGVDFGMGQKKEKGEKGKNKQKGKKNEKMKQKKSKNGCFLKVGGAETKGVT